MAGTLIRDALERVVAGDDLDAASSRGVMDELMDGAATGSQIGALLAALRVKGETVDEITGMVESMRAHAVTVQLSVDAVDTCGTGGDGHGTFNISTAAAIVTAGAGCAVAKHGNRAASSRCGSADVLEALGVAISLPPDGVRRCIDEAGIGFFYAPAFHPAMRHVAAARRELGFRTVFNMLGPLANPARVRRQALGVGEPRLALLMAGVLQRLGHERAIVFTGPDGLDELGLHGVARCYDVTPGAIVEYELDPAAYGLDAAPVADLHGGDAAANARTVLAVLNGVLGAPRDVVLFNSAAALIAAGRVTEYRDGIELARESIDSGAARRRLDALVSVSNSAAAA